MRVFRKIKNAGVNIVPLELPLVGDALSIIRDMFVLGGSKLRAKSLGSI